MRHETILVVGGTGFIGSHLVARLAAEGRNVMLVTRRYDRARPFLVLPTVQIIEGDIFDEKFLHGLLPQADALINLVGVLHSKSGQPWGPQFERAHVALPRLLAAACQKHGVKRCLHMSALGAGADAPSMYQRSKAEGEKIMLQASGLQVTSFRPSVVFGPEDQFLNLFARLQSLLPVLAMGGLDTKFQPVYVGDVADAFVRALDEVSTYGKTYELPGPHIYTLRELIKLAGKYSGHERPLIALPRALARLQAWMLEYVPGGPLMSRDNIDSMQADNVAHDEYPVPAVWQPVSLEAVAPTYLSPHSR